MPTVPVSHAAIGAFVRSQENEMCSEVSLDAAQIKKLRHGGIKMTRQEWTKVQNAFSHAINDKYRTLYFNKQSRARVVEQVREIERKKARDRTASLTHARDLLSVFDMRELSHNYIGQDAKGTLARSRQRNAVLELAEELPDSNALTTTTVDVIETYDVSRDTLRSSIKHLRELEAKLALAKSLRDSVASLEKTEFSLNSETDQQVAAQLKTQLQRTLSLI